MRDFGTAGEQSGSWTAMAFLTDTSVACTPILLLLTRICALYSHLRQATAARAVLPQLCGGSHRPCKPDPREHLGAGSSSDSACHSFGDSQGPCKAWMPFRSAAASSPTCQAQVHT